MRRLVPCAALVCLAFASTTSPASAQTVDEIVAKNLEAKGGVQKLRETNTVRLSGVMTLPGDAAPRSRSRSGRRPSAAKST